MHSKNKKPIEKLLVLKSEAAPRGGLGRTRPPQCFSGPIFQFVEIRGEIFRGGGTMVAHEKNEKKDHFVSDLMLKILQFYPGLLQLLFA